MNPAGGDPWSTWRCRTERSCRRGGDARQDPRSSSAGRRRLPPSDARRRDRRPLAAQRRHRVAHQRLAAGAAGFRLWFLMTERWNPVTEKFGALAPIYGTLITSLIAMLIAVPVGLMIAFFLTELCPPWLRRPIGIAIELLAGIPSIIYGIWGLFVFAPFLQETLQPFLITTLGDVPVLSAAFFRAALRHRHADGRPDPGHHGAAVHHLDLARRVRGGSRRCSRRRPTASVARPGRWCATSCCPMRGSVSSAA